MNQVAPPRQNDGSNEGPKYVQIRRHLIEQMRAGMYKASQPLPSESDLSVSLGVAVGTLRRALSGLESEGFIRREHGKGTFVNTSQEQREHVGTNIYSVILDSISEAPYPTLIEGLQGVAAGINHQLTVGSSGNNLAEQEKLIRLAVEHNVAGVVIVPTTFSTPIEQIRLLQARHIPVVFCHRTVRGIDAPLVTWPFGELGRLTADMLIGHGHRRIVSLLNVRYDFSDCVVEHVRSTLTSHDIDKSNYRVHYHGEIEGGDKLRHAVYETLGQILQGKERPTAIHCLNSQDAELVYLLAGEFGLKIPEDLSLICFGEHHPKGEVVRRITSVARDECEIGRKAGDLLVQMCSREIPLATSQTIEIPLTIFPGETVGPPP